MERFFHKLVAESVSIRAVNAYNQNISGIEVADLEVDVESVECVQEYFKTIPNVERLAQLDNFALMPSHQVILSTFKRFLQDDTVVNDYLLKL
jgi:hypothetical protein